MNVWGCPEDGKVKLKVYAQHEASRESIHLFLYIRKPSFRPEGGFMFEKFEKNFPAYASNDLLTFL